MCYTMSVHKHVYASGFLYHLPTEQILLQQPITRDASPSAWNMFGGESLRGEDAQTAFRRIMYDHIKIRLEPKRLFPVYDYMPDANHIVHYVFYAEVKRLYTFPSYDKGTLSWFTFKKVAKLGLAPQVKQDVMISERVIGAQARSNLA